MRGNCLISSHGFTLIETLVVIGLVAVVGAAALVFPLGGYERYLRQSDRDLFVAALHKARSQAMNGICVGSGCTRGKHHGVRIEGTQFIIFQTDSDYSSRDAAVDEVIETESAFVTGVAEVVFEQISGKVNTDSGDIVFVLGDEDAGMMVEINREGRISWTN